MVLLKRWGSGHVLYVERVLGITRCDVRDVVDRSTSGAQM